MSALQFLRDKAGVLVAAVIGLSLFIFVVSDFFGGGRSQRLQQRKYYEIGDINGEKISYQEYEQRIQNLQEIYKLSGTSNFDETTLENIREQMWQQIIRERVLDSHFENLGIGVSTEELEELVMGNNPHPIVRQLFTDRQTGMFNQSFLVNFLKSIETDETARKYWLFFEDEVVSDRMNSKFNNLVSKGLYTTSRQAEFDSLLNLRTVDFSYVVKSYSTVPDSIFTVSKKEIQEYYDNHKESYKRTAQRDIEFVTFDINPSEDDFRQAEQWILKVRSELAETADPVSLVNTSSDTRHTGSYVNFEQVPDSLKEFVKSESKTEVYGPYLEDSSFKIARLINAADRPDSVHARHILISPNETMTMQQARAKADSVANLIKKGMPFTILAQTNSDDQGSAQTGGDLGWFREGMMIAPFNNACFTSPKGKIEIVETNFGVHIIEILDVSKKVRKYEIGIIDRKVTPSSMTNQRAYNKASLFAGQNNIYGKFIKAVADSNLNKRVATSITPQQKTLPGLDKPRLLIMSLFQAKQGEIILDANSQAVFEIGDKYVVAYCTRVTEDGPAPLEDVETEVSFNVLREKKAEKIASELKAFTENNKSLDDIASAIGGRVQEAAQVNFRTYSVTGAGIEPGLIAAASVAEQGKVEGPVTGNNGVYLLTVNNASTNQNGDLRLIRDRLAASFQMRGTYEAYDALRKSASITDMRYKFY